MHKYQSAFLFEDTDTVKHVENKEALLLVELSDTIFYPGGGGQPCDTGMIKSDSFSGEVVEVYKHNNSIIHKVKVLNGYLKIGDKVDLIVTKERRMKLIKMHTGEHILFKSLELNLKNVSLTKIDLEEDESSLFITADEVSWDLLFKAEELTNKIIDENRPIIQKEYPKTDAVMMNKLRIKAERIASDTVRVLEVKDFDWAACTGTHADSTGFVRNLLITKYNQAKSGYEIRFKTDCKKELYKLAQTDREASFLLQTDDILNSIKRIQQESENYKGKFRELSVKLLNYASEEKIHDILFIYNVVEDLEKKQLVDKAASLIKEKTIVCFVNKVEGRASVLLSCSQDLKLNIPDILNKVLSKYNGKGGGRDTFAMGSVEERFASDIIEKIREEIFIYSKN
jgi:alanyl-tRNA synthetase